MALPLNQLEALSEAHADLINKKEELAMKLLQIEFDNDVERRVVKYLKDAEKAIMDSVKNGDKNTRIFTAEPNQHEHDFWKIYKKMDTWDKRPVAIHIAKELRKQGFAISLERMYEQTIIHISWENFHPNTKYKQPDFEEELKKLNDKIFRLTALNKQADKIIAE